MDSRWEELFEWRELVLRGLGVDRRLTAEDLSVEGLARPNLPDWIDEMVTQFRRLRHDARESAIRTYYSTRKVVTLKGCSRVHVPPGTTVTHAWCDFCKEWSTFERCDDGQDKCDACNQIVLRGEKGEAVDFSMPPPTKPYFHLSTDKWDHEYARNALLYFINEKGLDDEFLEWLKQHTVEED